ncbi:SPOSA6832_02172 [Sporobolomyces salmonicolor]|uniref:SPOSA6832_02172-mRNA-1:cds n=1 Tax=Sporidiobolus salmonicolor TaxID=5005 RepID=A0A0D6ELP7_SPOSA|nr:SPOSA6832_02172 [Sporobolomyces salmonicolor]
MGLLTIIRKTRLKEKQVRVLMLGLDNAGKTTICKALLAEDVNAVSPTLGFNIRTIIHQGYTLNVCEYTPSPSCTAPRALTSRDSLTGDIGGQTSLRPYWRNYFEHTDAVVWVVDSSDRGRMADCRRELHELLKEEVRPSPRSRNVSSNVLSFSAFEQRLVGASLLVFANKQDITNSMTIDEISAALDLRLISSSHHWAIQPCSARYVDPSASPLPPSSSSALPSSPSHAPNTQQPQIAVDPRIMRGLDWVVSEVASRVYYGSSNDIAPNGSSGDSSRTAMV